MIQMDNRLIAISYAVADINKSLLALQEKSATREKIAALEVAMDKINVFEKEQMHAIRKMMEDT